MLGENNASAQAGAVSAIIAFSDAVETVAGRDDPGVRRRALQIFAEILEDRRVLRGKRSEIVDGLVDAGREACGGHIMAQDSAVYDLREESGLRNQLSHQVRDIFLSLGRKRFLVARTPAEGDDNNF